MAPEKAAARRDKRGARIRWTPSDARRRRGVPRGEGGCRTRRAIAQGYCFGMTSTAGIQLGNTHDAPLLWRGRADFFIPAPRVANLTGSWERSGALLRGRKFVIATLLNPHSARQGGHCRIAMAAKERPPRVRSEIETRMATFVRRRPRKSPRGRGEGVEKDAPPSAEDDAEGSAKAKPSTDEKKDDLKASMSVPLFGSGAASIGGFGGFGGFGSPSPRGGLRPATSGSGFGGFGTSGGDSAGEGAGSTESGFPALSTVFGDANKPVQLFGKGSNPDEGADDAGDDDAPPESTPAETKPVIALQQEDVTTGEEDEECIFTTEGALYEFVTEEESTG